MEDVAKAVEESGIRAVLSKVDCVQLLNALDVCEFIFSEFNDFLSENI